MSEQRHKRQSNAPTADRRAVPSRGAPNRLWALGFLGGVIAIACATFALQRSPTETRNSQEAANSIAASKPVAVPAAVDLPVLPGLDKHRFDAVVRSVAEREDPVIDGWDSERFSELANAQLKTIGKMLSDGSQRDQKHVASVADESFQATQLRPARLEDVFRDPSLSVQRRADETADAQRSGGDGLETLLGALDQQAEPFQGLDDIRFKFKIVRVQLDGPTAVTRAYFRMSGRDAQHAIQVNSTWNCHWLREGIDPSQPRLTSVQVEDYEEVTYRSRTGPMFADCTESVFRNTDRFQRQLIYGIDHWTDRFDGAIARPAAGHGIAVGDVNGDGLEDVYLCQSPALPNLLLIQNPDGTVTDTAPEAGVNWLEGTRAALLVDLDNDGDQDLVSVLGNKVVFQANDGSGRFTSKAIVNTASSLFAINAVDYDNDSDLDIFICGYTLSSGGNLDDVFANPMPFHDANNGAPNVMLRNDGQWSFTDVTKQIGLDHNNMRFSYASAWEDYDNDGDLDVYIANDFGRNNLYRNDNGHFRDVAPESDVEDIGPGMSSAWGDFNNDAKPDLYVSNMFSSAGNRITHQQQFKTDLDESKKELFRRHARGNSLFQNNGSGGFLDRSVELGVTLGRWAWGSLFVDLNNDGWEDLYVTNGFITADDNNDL